MPVYNGQRFVDEAIASVVSQGYADLEFVIVDDGSTDDTPAILARWAARDSRIVLLRFERNRGISVALNRGLAVARGEYVARQDADDICLPHRLAQQVAVLDGQHDVALVSAGYELIEADGRRRATIVRTEPSPVIEHLMHFSNFVGGHGQVMFRRELVQDLGGYRSDYRYSQDYDLWSRLMRRGRFVILPIVGMRHRMHDERVSVRWSRLQMNQSQEISRRNLMLLLERDLTEGEFDAVVAVWRQTGGTSKSFCAHRVFTEAYERFKQKSEKRALRRRVRIATSQVWVIGAAMHTKHGRFLEALLYVGYSIRWHPLGFVTGTSGVAKRAAKYFWRSAIAAAALMLARLERDDVPQT
jgi:GT2 family glycosyltransferase